MGSKKPKVKDLSTKKNPKGGALKMQTVLKDNTLVAAKPTYNE